MSPTLKAIMAIAWIILATSLPGAATASGTQVATLDPGTVRHDCACGMSCASPLACCCSSSHAAKSVPRTAQSPNCCVKASPCGVPLPAGGLSIGRVTEPAALCVPARLDMTTIWERSSRHRDAAWMEPLGSELLKPPEAA